MRILMVDDEPYMLWLYQDLEGRKHEVTWAHDAAEARKCMNDQSFDMAIVDVVMAAPPDSSDPEGESQVLGLKLCKDILKTKWGKTKPVIVLSVLTEVEFGKRAAGVNLDTEKIRFCPKEPFAVFADAIEMILADSGNE